MPAKILDEPFTDPNPSGLCMCGCGETTRRWDRTSLTLGRFQGHHAKFVYGHAKKNSGPMYLSEDRGYTTPCWVWQRSVNVRWGYGAHAANGKSVRAHKWMWEQHHGPVPEGMDIDHLCRVRACVNPDHLEPVSRAVNAQRGAKSRLTPDMVREIRRLAASMTQQAIADRFDVTPYIVHAVIAGKTWKNIV